MSIPPGNSAVAKAVDKIYLLINSQMILEQKQAKLESHVCFCRPCLDFSGCMSPWRGRGVAVCASVDVETLLQGQGDGTAAARMAEIGETLEKLLALAKKKGYIGPDCTIETLKDEVRQRRQDSDQKEDEEQLNAMKNDLAEQTAAVRFPTPCTLRKFKGDIYHVRHPARRGLRLCCVCAYCRYPSKHRRAVHATE